ncbi:MAG TPA: hypothetical protein OIL90_05510 [Phascolarctobacterium faecium]|uniref:hypothetical protein n=1 Tax=Phascolarctobacterium faecium TaxID=33025 RepID=UPI00242B4376|nr:hypothetical protein [Phascolarctobacterium faecium]HJI09561.1 hypothetical protein [Phascolarctobacterium faecium]
MSAEEHFSFIFSLLSFIILYSTDIAAILHTSSSYFISHNLCQELLPAAASNSSTLLTKRRF